MGFIIIIVGFALSLYFLLKSEDSIKKMDMKELIKEFESRKDLNKSQKQCLKDFGDFLENKNLRFGWICPKCYRINSPEVLICNCIKGLKYSNNPDDEYIISL